MDVANAAESPLEGLAVHNLTLWIRPASHAPVATVDEVRAHHGVVEAAWKASPAVLPVRLGQWFASKDELAAAVEPKARDYARGLERVEGAGEFSLRILDPSLEEAPRNVTGSGTEYLRAAAERARSRADAEAKGRGVAAAMKRELGGLVREDRVEPLPTPHGLASVAHLVDRRREEEYVAAADRFGAAHPELRFFRTGPWPAWSFSA